jgi:hypothetical protein
VKDIIDNIKKTIVLFNDAHRFIIDEKFYLISTGDDIDSPFALGG